MSMGKGRAEFLQQEIVKAIKRARKIDVLSEGGVKEIFGKLLDDYTINFQVNKPQ